MEDLKLLFMLMETLKLHPGSWIKHQNTATGGLMWYAKNPKHEVVA